MVESRRQVKVKQLSGPDIDLAVSPDVSDFTIVMELLLVFFTTRVFSQERIDEGMRHYKKVS